MKYSEETSSVNTVYNITKLVIFVCMMLPAQLAFAKADLCIPTYDGVTGVPNANDGFVDGDQEGTGRFRADIGWSESTKFNLGENVNLGVENSVITRLVKDNNSIYLSMKIVGLDDGHSSDVIVLGISPDGTPSNDWRFHIYPFHPGGGVNEDGTPRLVQVWRNSSTWNNPATSPDPPTEITVSVGDWIYQDTRIWKSPAADYRWSIEIKLKRKSAASANLSNGIFFNPSAANPFLMYLNVFRTTGGTAPSPAVQNPWPWDEAYESGVLEEKMPSPRTGGSDNWASVSLETRPDCTGVSLTWNATGTTEDPPSRILLYKPEGNPITAARCATMTDAEKNLKNTTNTFKSEPINSMSTIAEDIKVTYRVATWGMPPLEIIDELWETVAETLDAQDIPAGPDGTAATGTFNADWQPTFEYSCGVLNHTHQCMVAIMRSPDGNTRFLNDSVRRNMDFVAASRFERDAVVSAKGYGEPVPGNTKQEFLILVDADIKQYEKHGKYYRLMADPTAGKRSRSQGTLNTHSSFDLPRLPATKDGPKVLETMTWIARGYRQTPGTIIIQGKEFQMVQEVGGFGYVAQHESGVAEWSQQLSGNGLSSTGVDGLYALSIDPEEEATIKTVIEAKDYKFAVNGTIGISDPQSNLNNAVDSGLGLQFGLEYLFSQNLSGEISLGYHTFDDSGLGADLDVLRASANVRYYFPFLRYAFFINGGIGAYSLDPGDTEFGANAGFGYHYKFTRRLALEAAYNYHDVDSSNPDVTFSTLQVGLRYLF